MGGRDTASVSYFFSNISLTEPIPIFEDVTDKINDWKSGIDSGNLNKIAEVCNSYLMPTVLCPWGCSEFLHKVGSVDIQLILQRYLKKCKIAIYNKLTLLQKRMGSTTYG